jgi:hypothetical protein
MTDPTKLTLDDWIAALDQSDAEIAAGDLVPGDLVHRAIQDRIDQLEAALSDERDRKAALGG